MDQLLLPHGMTIQMLEGVETVSDGYHTFAELYKHRHLLLCLLFHHDTLAWKSRVHADGTMYPGWFIAGTQLLCRYNTTEQHTPCSPYSFLQDITYHLPDALWDLCHTKVVSKAPPFDGHTSFDVLDRMERALRNGTKEASGEAQAQQGV